MPSIEGPGERQNAEAGADGKPLHPGLATHLAHITELEASMKCLARGFDNTVHLQRVTARPLTRMQIHEETLEAPGYFYAEK